MAMSRTSKNIMITFGIILAVVAYAYALYFQIGTLKIQDAQIAEYQDYYIVLQENNANFEALKKQQEELTSQQAVLNMKMPKSLDKPELMNYIFSMAANSGISPLDLNFEQIEDKGNYYSLAFTVICSGPQDKTYAFAEKVRKASTYILALDSITITTGETDDVTAQMRIIAYSYKGEVI